LQVGLPLYTRAPSQSVSELAIPCFILFVCTGNKFTLPLVIPLDLEEGSSDGTGEEATASSDALLLPPLSSQQPLEPRFSIPSMQC